MTTPVTPFCPQGAPQKIPKDGPGPRGFPEVYYTSRVLNSTFRYVKFVNKLRAEEEEIRKGNQIKHIAMKDQQTSDFFIRCDRRSLINNVARRVDLCMTSYEEDLKMKRARLMDLLKQEEEENIRKFIEQAQAGEEALWQDKQDRLKYLIEKRKKEHEEKYKDTPLSKCTHVTPCLVKIRAKDAQEFQLYQMKEKEARKMAEKELDKMWHEVAMKESEALAARMEQDAIERYRRDRECKLYSDYQLQLREEQKQKDREMLKKEVEWLKSMWEEDNIKEEEAERMRHEKRLETARERKAMIAERRGALQQQRQHDQLVASTWDSLAGQGLADEHAKIQLIKKKERELDECNKRMNELRAEVAKLDTADDHLFAAEAKRIQNELDKKRCAYLLWSQKTNKDVRQAMVDQINERKQAKENLRKRMEEEEEYHRELFEQLSQLCKHKDLMDAERRKLHQRHLLEQIEYNKLLKERALQEEMDQRRKAQKASEEYDEEIKKMVQRPFFSEEVHPFMKQMAKGLDMREKCPCSKPNYCK